MSTTAPTTMLAAVNELLTAIGTTPVNTLSASGLTDAAIAKDTIEAIAREVQTNGWWFNTSRSVNYTPTANEIVVPANVARITPAMPTSTSAGETTQFVLRDGKLFNIMTNSFTFTVAVRADILVLLAFEQLPESVRRFIAVRSARIFQTKVLGDENLGVFTSVHEQEAYEALERDHLMSGHSTIYLDRMLQRFKTVRPDPVGYQPRQQQGQG